MIDKVIVFDAYGTLFDVGSVNMSLARLFPDKSIAISQLWRFKQLEYTWLRALMDNYCNFESVTCQALDYVLAHFGLDLEEAERQELSTAYLRLTPHPEVRECLEALSLWQRSILSNGTSQMLWSLVESASLTSQFDSIMSADAVKTFKPHPRVYRLVTEYFSVEASEVTYVTSNSWDAAGAKSFGFFTCWVNRFGDSDEEIGISPDLKVSNLRELVSALGS